MKKVIFICSGNTCRSPMAEGFSKELFNCSAESYGMAVLGSCPASFNSQTAMADIGIDISAHKSRQLTKEAANKADHIVAISSSIYDVLHQIFGGKVCLLRNGISDPFGGDLDEYKKCRNQIFFGLIDLFLDIDIKFMTDGDIKDIAQLEKDNFSIPWSENSLKEELDNPDARFLVAKHNGKVCGYTGMHNNSDEGYISNVAVVKDFRNKGIGKALITAQKIICSDEEMEFISLEVRQSNYPAIELYKKMGFVKVGERKNFYQKPTENADIMTFYRKGEK